MISLDHRNGMVDLPVFNIFDAIRGNCQGQPRCVGIVSNYRDVTFLSEDDDSCGWETVVSLNYIDIIAQCIGRYSPVVY